MVVKVLLETQCAGCKNTLDAVRAVVPAGTTVEAITDVKQILAYKVWRLPAVVIDEKVVSTGRNLNVEQAAALVAAYNE